MEHRYADESGPSWYTGNRYPDRDQEEATGSHAFGGDPYDTGGLRLPEQRPADSGRIPIRGAEYPPVQPSVPPFPAPGPPAPLEPVPPVAEPTSLVPPVTAERRRSAQGRSTQGRSTQSRSDQGRSDRGRPADGVYRTRRPLSAVILAVAVLVLLVPVLRLLMTATFAGTPTARGIVPAVLLTLGLALTGFGLFAAAGTTAAPREAWLRPPLVYLPAGLILLLAAGLAVA
ncbi:hypothetical protein [Actinoplanes sp. NPDC051851]|uniref:hypothetical protein n=1 Tax=Actinoplanes sp. NPDC051851 TaxID=3154753 RepID=UPI00341D0A8D